MREEDPGPASDAATTPRVEPATRVEPVALSDEEVLSRLRSLDRIGRFTFLRRLGEGGMGIVTLAYDEELDRKVALKMIRQGLCEQPEHRRRLLREAQALARLSHPNVVTIYEVGEHLGRPYLAMEFVEGSDLRTWLRTPRPRHEVLRVFREAGRGLAAAHAVGLVHRDFKPANVLVGADGRARVLDFGLSRPATPDPGRPTDDVTSAGVIVGTPVYMSPEQLMGQPLDGRSDQYSFAIALHEALAGVRPFGGRSLLERIREGGVAEVDPSIPRPLQRVLTRALAVAPEQRFPSMDALLAALSADPWRPWRRLAGVLALTGAALGLGYALRDREVCTDAAAHLAGLWDDDVRGSLRGALLPDPAAPAAGALRLLELLDAQADAWTGAHRDACVAHHRGESSDAALDRRMRCLDHARVELGALVDALRGRGAGDLDDILVAANDLPAARACLDLDALSPGPPPPLPESAAEVDALRERLARAALARADGLAGAREEVRAILARAEALTYRPLVAEAHAALGRLASTAAEYEESAREFEAALWLTTVVDDPAETADLMASLLYLLGDRLGRDDLAQRWRAHADALRERLGERSDGTARLSWALGAVAIHHHRADEALAEMRRATQITEALHGPDHAKVGHNLSGLGAALGTAGQYTASLRTLERALPILERAYGPDHGDVITLLNNISVLHRGVGDAATAVQVAQDALVRAVRRAGDDDPQVALVLSNLALARMRIGQDAQARSDLVQARAIQRLRLGAHRELHQTLSALVDVELDLGDLAAARFHATELVDVALAIFPADAPAVLEAFAKGLDVEGEADAPEAALALAERALARPLERGAREAPDLVGYLRFHAARALRRLRRDPTRARELAAAAEPALAAQPDTYPDELAELAAWRERPPRGARADRTRPATAGG